MYRNEFHFNCKIQGVSVDVLVNEVEVLKGNLQSIKMLHEGKKAYEFCVAVSNDEIENGIMDLFIAIPSYQPGLTFERLKYGVRNNWDFILQGKPSWSRVEAFVREILADIEEYEKPVE